MVATAVPQVALRSNRRSSGFYAGLALVSVLVIFAGFARTYYLKPLFHTRDLSVLLHIHGVIMTCWMGLLIVQTKLVANRRIHVHRQFGVAGGVIAIGAISTGLLVAIRAVQLGHAPTGVPPLSFLIIPFGDIAIFALTIALAFFYRHRPEIHKRLIVVSTITILPPGIARWPWTWVAHHPLRFFGVADLILLVCVIFDIVRTRRLHPVYLWGGSFLVLSHPLRLEFAHTQIWLAIARWMTGVH